MKSAAVALALIRAASAQSSSIISVFLPDTDQQTLVGSLVASDASKTTIAFGCPSGVDSSDCGYGAGQVTATFGPSTFLATEILDPLIVTLNCAVSGTTAASCIQTYVGPIGVFNAATATDDSLTATDTSFNSQITTSVTTTILAQTDITFLPVTLTAFPNHNATGSTTASTGTGASAGAATTTASSALTAITSGGNATATAHKGDATGTGGSQWRWSLGLAGFLVWLRV